jgi:hypothetical protein
MGVIIGSLMDDSALCVEAPESPDIKISEPTNVGLNSMGAVGPDVVYGFIGPARTVSVTRIFTLRKKDIAAVTNWIASLSGSSLEYNAGSDGDKIIAGDFKLDGEITFKSNSPTLCTATATFIGQVLDCNFLLPSGLEFRNLSATESAIFIDNVERTRWTTKDKGDESGIVFKAGRALFWDEVPEPDRDGLPVGDAADISPDADIPLARFIPTASYRELHMTVNGYIVKTWYIPTKIRNRARAMEPKPIWYGITEDEYLADGIPVFDSPLDLSDSTNPRLYGGATNDPETWWRQMPIPKPDGVIYQWFGYSQMVNGEPWSPKRSTGSGTPLPFVLRLRWSEQLYGKRPYDHSRMYLIGYAWQFMYSSEYRWSPFYNDEQLTVSVGWAKTDDGIYLTAIGSNGQIITLLEYAL